MHANGPSPSTRNLITGMLLSGLMVLWLMVAVLQDPSAKLAGIYRVRLPDVTSLKVGNPVRVRGAVRGAVAHMRVVDAHAELVLRMDEDLVLTQGAAVRVRPKTLLGGRYLEIVPGPADAPPLAPNALLAAARQPVSPTELSDFIEDSIPEQSSLIEQAAGTLSLMRAMADDAKRLQPMAERAAELRGKLTKIAALTGRVSDSLGRLSAADFERVAALAERLHHMQHRLADMQEVLALAGAAFDGRLERKAGQIEASLARLTGGLERADAAQTDSLKHLEKALEALLVFDERFIRRILQSEGVRALTDPAQKRAVEARIRELEAAAPNEETTP